MIAIMLFYLERHSTQSEQELQERGTNCQNLTHQIKTARDPKTEFCN